MDGFMGQESMGRGGEIIGMKVSRIWKAREFIRRKKEDSLIWKEDNLHLICLELEVSRN